MDEIPVLEVRGKMINFSWFDAITTQTPNTGNVWSLRWLMAGANPDHKHFYICPALIRAARPGLHSAIIPSLDGTVAHHTAFPASAQNDVEQTKRKPMLLLKLSGSFLLRQEQRALFRLLFHEPPRSTRVCS
jgi:hypothetical protein